MQNNETLKELMKSMGVPQWKVAQVMGVHENTLGRLLRRPVNQQMETIIRGAIEAIGEQEGKA